MALESHQDIHVKDEDVVSYNKGDNDSGDANEAIMCSTSVRSDDDHQLDIASLTKIKGGKAKQKHITKMDSSSGVSDTLLYCDVCEIAFMFRSEYDDHIKMHEPSDTLITCDHCGTEFQSESSFREHQTAITCIQCHQTFQTLCLHKQHFVRMHKTEKKKCIVCGRLYSNGVRLETHLKMHTQNALLMAASNQQTTSRRMLLATRKPPYECYTCKKMFFYKQALKAHVQLHNSEKED